MMKLYLASKSPRRRELLDQIEVSYECLNIDINEDWDGQEQPRDYVARLALEKAQAGFSQLEINDDCAVLGADTSVVLDDHILGKATTEAEAMEMLQRLSGRCHHVYTGVALVGNDQIVRVNTNRVFFRSLSEKECQLYCQTGEPLGKAGGYAVQGKAAVFIERLEGSYSGVMGLPLYETGLLLSVVGINS
ncbi:MAG: nucleoside triphosphate pyrophosphatase [Gammaproteobacteria bacterium]